MTPVLVNAVVGQRFSSPDKSQSHDPIGFTAVVPESTSSVISSFFQCVRLSYFLQVLDTVLGKLSFAGVLTVSLLHGFYLVTYSLPRRHLSTCI